MSRANIRAASIVRSAQARAPGLKNAEILKAKYGNTPSGNIAAGRMRGAKSSTGDSMPNHNSRVTSAPNSTALDLTKTRDRRLTLPLVAPKTRGAPAESQRLRKRRTKPRTASAWLGRLLACGALDLSGALLKAPSIDRLDVEAPIAANLEARQLTLPQQSIDR
jgi:hypothetical protein